MNIHRFALENRKAYPIAALVPTIRPKDIEREYFSPVGINPDNCLAFQLPMRLKGKTPPKKERVAYIKEFLVPALISYDVSYLIVGNSDYFKDLTGCAKSEAMLGYVVDCVHGSFKVVYVPNYTAIFYNPEEIRSKILSSLSALRDYASGTYTEPGTGIIKQAHYPKTDPEIEEWLNKILAMNVPISVDCEAFDLKHHKSGIGTIAISWNQHEGIAFPVDYVPIEGATKAPFGTQERNEKRRELLRNFFETFNQKVIYHNISFDGYILVYHLYMSSIIDTEGLLKGMEVILKNWDCTKIISYLATNTCAGNDLSLKNQAQEFAGNWAVEDIKDISKIPLDELLQYNLVDTLSTHYVYSKNHPIMVADEQEDIYLNIFKPATLDVIQMQLTGLPIHMGRVNEIEPILLKDRDDALAKIHSSEYVKEATERLRYAWVDKRNSELKVKRVSYQDAILEGISFNPASDPNMQLLLFTIMELPILDKTESGAPSVNGDTLKSLVHHTKDDKAKELLKALVDYAAVAKIITTYLTVLKEAVLGPDGWHYVFGSFNLGGTVSGRLSSSNPNLQNIPVKGKYGKLILYCVVAPQGWLIVGLDFDALEDKISALTTKDKNKLKVYTDGFDGHCLRAFSYWPEKFPGIVNTVESINSIKELYPDERGQSKEPTFLLTYGGSYRGLMKNVGFLEQEAKNIETRFRELYSDSIDWVADKLQKASKTGYVTAAFGLRIRTPLLYQVVMDTKTTPREAAAEGRTAGNGLGQSWCMLNNRACSEFMSGVRKSEFRLNIRPFAQIHDAQYYLVKADLKSLEHININLVKAVSWQDHPDIQHDTVKLSGSCSVFYPSWKDEIVIPNGATQEEIKQTIIKGPPKK